jgi:hypothetical protein
MRPQPARYRQRSSVFAVPFDEIASITDRSPAAARQLASRDGDFAALLEVLDPDIVLREDDGTARPAASAVIRGAREVAGRPLMFSHMSLYARLVLVNGASGVVVLPEGQDRPFALMAFTVMGGRVVEINVMNAPARLGEIDLSLIA